LVYICKRCGRVFKSYRAYLAHILIGLEGSYKKSSKGRKR